MVIILKVLSYIYMETILFNQNKAKLCVFII